LRKGKKNFFSLTKIAGKGSWKLSGKLEKVNRN
jgi:hypothetical protein